MKKYFISFFCLSFLIFFSSCTLQQQVTEADFTLDIPCKNLFNDFGGGEYLFVLKATDWYKKTVEQKITIPVPTGADAGVAVTNIPDPKVSFKLKLVPINKRVNITVDVYHLTKGDGIINKEKVLTASQIFITKFWHETHKLDLQYTTVEKLRIQKPSQYQYRVGDVVFTDGSVLPVSQVLKFSPEEWQLNISYLPFGVNVKGVVFKENDPTTDSEKACAVGLYQKEDMAWCMTEAGAYNSLINDLVCEPYVSSSLKMGPIDFTQEYSFKNKDSSEAETCGKEALNSISAVNNNVYDQIKSYPIFDYAQQYGSTYGDNVSKYYIPTIAELFELAKNRETVNKVMQIIGGDIIDNKVYWSSSMRNYQDYGSTNYKYALYLDLESGKCNITMADKKLQEFALVVTQIN